MEGAFWVHGVARPSRYPLQTGRWPV